MESEEPQAKRPKHMTASVLTLEMTRDVVVRLLDVKHVRLLACTCRDLSGPIFAEWEHIYAICQHPQPHGRIESTPDDGPTHVVEHFRDGKLHCLDGPAVEMRRTEDGEALVRKKWYRYGVQTRGDDLPADICYRGNVVARKIWLVQGFLHRGGEEPAWIEYSGHTFAEYGISKELYYKLGAEIPASRVADHVAVEAYYTAEDTERILAESAAQKSEIEPFMPYI